MSKMIQIRHVPDDLHRTLKLRATGAGLSLSDYLRRELELIAASPSDTDIAAALAELDPVQLDYPDQAVDILREARGPMG